MSKKQISRKGTGGRVYGGDPDLVHIPDGHRADVGQWLARTLADRMRSDAANRTRPEKDMDVYSKPLCPGCYMVVLFNAAVALAKDSGQSFSELGRTMSEAFAKLATCPDDDQACIEEIAVKLDGGLI